MSTRDLALELITVVGEGRIIPATGSLAGLIKR